MAKISYARQWALKLLQQVDQGSFASVALSNKIQELDRLANENLKIAEDKSLCTQLLYGTLTYKIRIDYTLKQWVNFKKSSRLLLNILRMAFFEILFLRTPAYAVVNEAVNLAKKTLSPPIAGLVNAIIRKLIAQSEAPLPNHPLEKWSVFYSLPIFIIDDAFSRFSDREAHEFLESLNQPAPIWLRNNLLQVVTPSSSQYRLPEAVKVEGPGLMRLPAYEKGEFSVQDLGAQLVGRLLFSGGHLQGAILDICCGQGGKTLHLFELGQGKLPIYAIDASLIKLKLAQQNVLRARADKVAFFHGDGRSPSQAIVLSNTAFPQDKFQGVLLDAPCSTLGVIRRHPEARDNIWPEKISKLLDLQRHLLHAAADLVHQGGFLVYAVCSYREEEGPQQITEFLRTHPEFIIASPSSEDTHFQGLIDAQGALRTWPHRDSCDAFYAIRLQKIR